jgi:hypothetical protein
MNSEFEIFLDGFNLTRGVGEKPADELRIFTDSNLPLDYVQLLEFSDGANGWREGRFLSLFSAQDAIRINQAAKTKQVCPGKFIFASNAGGTSFLLDLVSSPNARIYQCEDVDLGPESMKQIAGSIHEFLQIYGPAVA